MMFIMLTVWLRMNHTLVTITSTVRMGLTMQKSLMEKIMDNLPIKAVTRKAQENVCELAALPQGVFN